MVWKILKTPGSSIGFSSTISSQPILTDGKDHCEHPLKLFNEEIEIDLYHKGTERKFSFLGSPVIPYIREKLEPKGLNGKGITVGVVETYVDEENQLFQPLETERLEHMEGETFHAKQTTALLCHQKFGIAPGVNYHLYNLPQSEDTQFTSLPSKSELDNYISELLLKTVQDLTKKLEEIINDSSKNKNLRVINASLGRSLKKASQIAWYMMHGLTRPLDVNLGNWYEIVYGTRNKEKVPIDKQLQAVIDYVSKLYESNGFTQVMDEYRKLTRALAEKGIIVIVAVGNDHDDGDSFRTHLLTDPRPIMSLGAEFGFLAQSDHVISVASCESTKNSKELDHCKVSQKSSRGDGKIWNPTLAAPGEVIFQLKDSSENIIENHVSTSAACPFVSGIIAIMLEMNPDLTFEEIKNLLEVAAYNNAHIRDISAAGAGIINPFRVLDLVR